MKFKSHAHRKAVFANLNMKGGTEYTGVSREKVTNFEVVNPSQSIRPRSMGGVSNGRMKGQSMKGVGDSGFSYQQFVSTDDYTNMLYKRGIKMPQSAVSRELGHLKSTDPELYKELVNDNERMVTYLQKQSKKKHIEKGLKVLRRELDRDDLKEMKVEDVRETLELTSEVNVDALSDKMIKAMVRKVKSERRLKRIDV